MNSNGGTTQFASSVEQFVKSVFELDGSGVFELDGSGVLELDGSGVVKLDGSGIIWLVCLEVEIKFE